MLLGLDQLCANTPHSEWKKTDHPPKPKWTEAASLASSEMPPVKGEAVERGRVHGRFAVHMAQLRRSVEPHAEIMAHGNPAIEYDVNERRYGRDKY